HPEQTLEVGPFKISFLETEHPVVCYAFRIEAGGESIVYTADSSYLDGFVEFTKDADLFVCECNFYADQDGKPAGHMNSIDAGSLAHDANVGELLLTHLPHYGDHEELIQQASERYSGKIEVSHAGW